MIGVNRKYVKVKDGLTLLELRTYVGIVLSVGEYLLGDLKIKIPSLA